jgi:hypothetical protein
MAARKATPRSAPKGRSASAADQAKPAKATRLSKPPELRRRPMRDSVTLPDANFALIATLKARALAAQRETKKSELLRAGLHVLAALGR